MKHKITLLLATVVALFGITSCTDHTNEAPRVESDSNQSYITEGDTGRIPVDDQVYTVRGRIVGDVDSLTRQTEAARGSTSGSCYGSSGGGLVCSSSGSYFGPEVSSKGMVRLYVMSAKPETESAPVEHIVVLKVTDTKGSMLLNDDIVTFKCRRQYEAIAAVRENEKFNASKAETWELDYCRLEDGTIEVAKPTTVAP